MLIYSETNLTDVKRLICWNCGFSNQLANLSDAKCQECNSEINSPELLYDKKETIKEIIKIKVDSNVYELDVQDLQRKVSEYFKVKNFALGKSLMLVVEEPEKEVDESYQKVLDIIRSFIPEVNVRLSHQYIRNIRELTLSIIPIQKRNQQSRRIAIILFITTFLSIFIAGLYDYSNMLGGSSNFLGLAINTESLFFSIQFTGTLFLILLLKDIQPHLASIMNKQSVFNSYLIPAPPIFELGTIGSFVSQSALPRDKEEMFRSAFFGPFFAWVVALIIFVFTFSWGTVNSSAASTYKEHSVIFNKEYTSLFLKYFMQLSGEPVAVNTYILHPITMGALAGMYICGLYFLPISHLSGGYLFKAVTGDSWHLIITSIFILYFAFNIPLVGLGLLTMHMLKRQPMVLNEESRVSATSKILMVVALVIAISSFPLPL